MSRRRAAKYLLTLTTVAILYVYTRYNKYQRRTRWYRVKNSIVISTRRIPAIARLIVGIFTTGSDVWRPTLEYLKCAIGIKSYESNIRREKNKNIILYAWPLSYFSGKVRALMKYQSNTAGIDYEEVMATPAIIRSVLLPATKSHTVPQIKTVDGDIVHDSTQIIDVVSSLPGATPVLPSTMRQKLACQLLELLADEWLLVPAFHWRWAYSGDGSERQRMPMVDNSMSQNAGLLRRHRDFNIAQWGKILSSDVQSSSKTNEIGRFLIDRLFLNGDTVIKRCMIDLGVTEKTVAAWEASARRALGILNCHLGKYAFVLGGRPSSADFALLGPIFAHLFRDPFPNSMMCADFPNVVEWAKRLHDGDRCAEIGRWMRRDMVPPTILPLLKIFFDEMWPVLKSSCRVLRRYIVEESPSELPAGSFGPTSIDQEPGGPLTHTFALPFDLNGSTSGPAVKETRMVLPYQVWLLQRVESTLSERPVDAELLDFLRSIDGLDLLHLSKTLRGCRVRKVGGKIFVK